MIGIISAFGAAISWTYACFIWRSQTEKYKSIDINFVKNVIAFLIFLPAFINIHILTDFKSLLSPFLMAIPAQLLAYHVANERGTDVDQPRNLAKSVTVE